MVVLFDENISFDHYFGTYPYATNPPGEPQFTAAPGTPRVNGLNDALLDGQPEPRQPAAARPQPGARPATRTTATRPSRAAFDGGLMDQFVQNTTGGGCTQTTTPDKGNYGPNGIVMDYYDGNTVTGLWNSLSTSR